MSAFPLRFAAAIALATLTCGAQSAVVYSLANTGSSLVRFDSASPSAVTILGAISGATSTLDGLDFRPANGRLYGYSSVTSGIYLVDPSSGATTLVSNSSAPVTARLGIDFNPTVDRLRVVTVNDENRRINVDNGAAIVDGMLAFAAGDPNFGVNPSVIDAAYTNNDPDPATGTQLYYIDYVLDALLTTSNPNAGVLNTVGALGVNADEFLGFDVFTGLDASNTAYASLRVAGVDGLYTINLATGAATLVGAIGAARLFGLAVAPAVAVVPEPGSLALVVAAVFAVLGVRRRRVSL